ncbi:uncharacterized protein LOC135486599 isoform X2 [Lineus longissimus]|uniref:uncharacterized protein LOC135486599 isoform X2 n=1 Tax=Lineus longissimus TaxID=88925 RepID=UPI00315D9790
MEKGYARLPCAVLFILLFSNVPLANTQDLILPPADFKPQPANPIAVKGNPVILKFDLIIKNDAAGSIGATALGGENYAVDFYFSTANNDDQSAVATKQPLTASGTAPKLDFGLNGNSASSSLTFEATGTLPTTACSSYIWFCGCVKKGTTGTATAYTDTPTNNCACKDAKALISCDPDIIIETFNPNAGNFPIFTIYTPGGDLADFTLKVKNDAAVGDGNQIGAPSSPGDNYAIDVYLAQSNLETTPSAIKDGPYPATLTGAGDLKETLAPGASTGLLTMSATGIEIPIAECTKYVWICAHVKKGTGAQYKDKTTNNNYKCADATAKTFCPIDIILPPADFIPQPANPIAVKGNSVILRFDLIIKNDDEGPIEATTPAGGDNYEVDFYFSTADNDDQSAVATKQPLTASGTAPTLDFGLNGNSASSSLTFEATGTLPTTACSSYTWFCGCVKKGTTGTATAYTDTPTNNNCACKDAKALISCDPDIIVETFDPNAGNFPTLVKNTPETLTNFEVVIKNNAAAGAGNQIGAPTSPDDNYAIDIYLAQADLETTPGATKDGPYPATLTGTGDLKETLAPGASAAPNTLTANGIKLPIADCNKYVSICALVKKGTGAQYLDSVTTNNYKCADASTKISCPVDIIVTDFAPKATNPIAIHNIETTGLLFDLKIKNDATAGSDVIALPSPKKNYEVEFYFSKDDLATNPASTAKVLLTNTNTPTTLYVGLLAQDSTALITYTAKGTLPTTNCNSYINFCACVKKGPDADYTDEDTTNNCMCKDAKLLISCFPDIIVETFDPNAGNFPTLVKNTPETLTNFEVVIKNNAAAGAGNQIGAPTSPDDNYAIDIYLAQADLETTPGATKDGPYPATLTGTGDLKETLAPGASAATNTLTANGIKLPIADCNKYVSICALVKKGTGAQYLDSVTTNNYKCADASTKISCPVDIIVTDFAPKATNPIAIHNIETTGLLFDLKIKNDATAGSDVIALPSPKKNYGVEFYFSKDDLATNPASTAKVLLTNTNTPTTLYVGLLAQDSTALITYTAKGTLPTTNCNSYINFCACVKKGPDADYTDEDTTNNCMCKDAKLLISCFPDIIVDPFDPTAGNWPTFHTVTPKSLSDFTLKVKNIGVAGDGNQIGPPTSPDDNYAIDIFLVKDDLAVNPTAAKHGPYPAAVTSGDLKDNLAPGASTSLLTMTASGITLPAGDCNSYEWVCACVKKGTGGQYVDTVTTDNCKCEKGTSSTLDCPIDAKLTAMTLTIPTAMTQGSTPTIGFSADITNEDTTKDIAPVTVLTNYNFDCIMRYAETDIGKGAAAGLDPFVAPNAFQKKFSTDCIPGNAALQSGLNSGQTRTLTGQCTLGALTQAVCKDAKYICLDCAVPTGANGATFIDKKLTNNIKCERIDSNLTCDIDLELDNIGITQLCPATITSGVATNQTINTLTIKNNNAKVSGSKVNDVKANTGNFKFEYLFSSSAAHANIVGTVKLVTAVAEEWGDELKASDTFNKQQMVSITLADADCTAATHICLKVSKGATTTYKELTGTGPPNYDDNNYKCCPLDIKICSANPKANSVAINPAVSFKAGDPTTAVILDVELENDGAADIAVAPGLGFGVNFNFVQFFAAGDYCADKSLATTPAPTRCDSLVSGTPGADSALQKGAGNKETFQVRCDMKLTKANCKNMTKICVEFTTGTDATYTDSNPADNCKCTAADITKVCLPDVEAISLTEKNGPITLKDYVSPSQALLGFDLVIRNAEPDTIPAAGATPNFGAKCSMQNATGVKIGTPDEETVTITANANSQLTGGVPNGPSITLTGTVTLGVLPPADCTSVTRVCCTVFAPSATPNYEESDSTNNEACLTTTSVPPLHTNCKPVFKAGTGMDVPAGKTLEVEENTPVNDVVFTLEGTDPTDNPVTPPKEILTYEKVSGDGDGYFSLDQATGEVKVAQALDFEKIPTTSFTIVYAVKDQDGANGASSTGTLKINLININEKPTIAAAEKPDPTTITSKGVSGDSRGLLHIGVPESYSGSIFEITFTDEDTADTPSIASFTMNLTLPVGDTNPFLIKNGTLGKHILEIDSNLVRKDVVTTYKVQIEACDNGPPEPPARGTNNKTLCSNTIEITVDIIPVDDPPAWTQPIIPVTIKEDVTAENLNVITVTAVDNDTNALSFRCQCNPVENIFSCLPVTPPANGKELTITHKKDPGFDYETTKTYTCYIFVMDSHNLAVMDKVIINIEDVNEAPTMKLPPTNEIKVPELHCYGCHLYDYKCTDPDGGQKTTSTFKVYDTPFDLQAKSKFQLDSLDRLLLNFDNNIIRENLNKYLTQFKCCDDGSPQKCVSQNITLVVEAFNRAPTFKPNTTGITIYEIKTKSTVSSKLNLAGKFKDPEGDGPTCGIVNSRYSNYFSMAGNTLRLEGPISYDDYNPPHHFYISISCSDNGALTRTDAPNVPALSTEMLVEVNVLGLDDNTPVFAPTSYIATLFEDAFSTQSVVTVTATDRDLGVHGQMIYQLDPNDPNKVLANELFSIVQLDNNEAEIRCRGGLDVEKYSSVIFEVNAVSPGPKSTTDTSKQTGTATVTVYIRNVNDLRPQWVTPDYINLEISTTAKVDKLMTTVSCTDADILYNNVNYDQISILFGGSDYFKTDVYSGQVRSNYTPYEEDDRYFVRVVCKDTDPKEDFSGIAIVRIDTYVNWKHVSNWTLCKPMADYNASDQEAFLASVATLCPPCIPKIHDVSEKDGKAVFQLYFIKDNTTYAKNAREYNKVFLETDDILKRYYDETSHGPKQSVKDDPVFGGCLLNITRFAYEPKDNWFLDTIGGNFMLGFLMSLGFALLVTAVICCARKAAPGRVRVPVTPKGSRPVAPKKVPDKPVQPKPTTPAPKKQKRPPTPESESDEESDTEPSREPTPKPIRKKFDKFV